MNTLQNQAELSDVPRRHGERAGQLSLIASTTLAAYMAVAVGAGAGRAQAPNSNAVGISLNRASIGERVRVALQGEVIDNPRWNWTPGPVYYEATTGVLQQTPGVPLGVAITPTRLLILNTGALPSPTALGLGTMALQDADAVAITGGTIQTTGNITVGDGTGVRELYVNSAVGSAAILSLQSNGVTRWAWLKDSVAETGADAGAGMELRAHSDAGANLGAVVSIVRAAGGAVTISRPVSLIAGSETDPSIEFPGGRGIYDDGVENIYFTDGTLKRIAFSLQSNGNTGMEFGRVDGSASLTFFDFHTGATAVDYDARIIVQNGTGVNAGARMDIACGQFTLSPAGSDAAPTLTRTTDLDTGWLWPAANTLAASVGGTRVITATSATVQFPEGIDFGADVAASTVDLTRHLALFSTTYGFSITANRLNYVAPAVADHMFVNGAGTDLVRIDSGGLNVLSGTLQQGGVAALLTSDLGVTVQEFGADLTAIEALAGTGFLVRTGSGTWAQRQITTPNAGLTTTNGNGVSGAVAINPSDDLAAIEALASTGIAVRTAANTWAQRTVTGTTDQVSVTNGNGVSGNPTIALADGVPRKIASGNIATGTNSTTINIPAGAWKRVDVIINGLTCASDFNAYIRINGDTTSGNYRYAQIAVNTNTGATTGIFGNTTPTAINLWSTASAIESTNNTFNTVFTIFDPSNTTKRKQGCIGTAACIAASDGVVYATNNGGWYWLSTAAITSLTLIQNATAGISPGGAAVNASSGTYEVIGYL